MSEQIVIAIIEMSLSLFIEGIILSFVFNWISNTSSEKQQKNLKNEMNNIETQNKFIFEMLQKEIKDAKSEIISQIKESEAKK
jgi:adenine-specific DNA methylase